MIAANPASAPGVRGPLPSRSQAITPTPPKPTSAARIAARRIRSPSTVAASPSASSGAMNEIAMLCASGVRTTP